MSNSKHRSTTIPHTVRFQTWRKRFITMDGFCMVCANPIGADNFVCGHIISKHHGGKAVVSNLEPICSPCNSSMNSRNLYEYKKILGHTLQHYINAEKKVNMLLITHLAPKLDVNTLTCLQAQISNSDILSQSLLLHEKKRKAEQDDNNNNETKKRKIRNNNTNLLEKESFQTYVNNYFTCNNNDNNCNNSFNNNNIENGKSFIKKIIFNNQLNEFCVVFWNTNFNNYQTLDCNCIIQILWLNILHDILVIKTKSFLKATHQRSYHILTLYRNNNQSSLLKFLASTFKKVNRSLNLSQTGLSRNCEQNSLINAIKRLYSLNQDHKKSLVKYVLHKWYGPNVLDIIVDVVSSYVLLTTFKIWLVDTDITDWKNEELNTLFKIFDVVGQPKADLAYRITSTVGI